MRKLMRPDQQIVKPERYFTVAILSGAISVISLLGVLLSASAASQRNLGAGHVVELFGYSAAVERSEVAMIHCMAVTGFVVGIAGCLTALALYIRS